ncbi:polysaccharide deacetylase [Desulfofarcimen acetoxidans DSM 771]|uniref:Polysaccharide deacetylase n=1 Tax=Desulfofarcimen acetoxidans (strain ATCC 49208 / DSM 771 / KCTC 5769 / VKM B-1644 / 5575) TaxID=485916 RepID=C8W4N5_DESAS|nr:polysaccharide deacetylase [Desulfofarcimen acetoxidans DSM 771]
MRVLYLKRRYVSQLLIVVIFAAVFTTGYFWANFNKAVLLPVVAEPIYQGSDSEKKIALTVNVFWGEEYLPKMLEIMDENKVKASFFMGGQWVEKFPDLTKKIAAGGHELGNHGYSHPHVDQISKQNNITEIKKAEEEVFKVTGKKTVFFAPPYGERGQNVLAAASESGYKTILWSIDTVDWQRPAAKTIEDRVLAKAHNGAIVLMHPTEPTIKALPNIIKDLKDRGYELVTVSQLLKGGIAGDKENKTGEETKDSGKNKEIKAGKESKDAEGAKKAEDAEDSGGAGDAEDKEQDN